jgi:hypothetical protein
MEIFLYVILWGDSCELGMVEAGGGLEGEFERRQESGIG